MTAKVLVSGFVQGVRYRKFVEKKAKELGLKGWVKNLPDTRVEAYFSGNKEDIGKIIEMLWEGSFLAQVRSVNVEWEEDGGEHSEFIILR
ncbi:MAG: acylphosphatase [Patescibacteria group bacterium]